MRNAFQGWFRDRYQAEYAWTGREAKTAKDLLAKAGDGGPAEVMRRAERAAEVGWLRGPITLGTVAAKWNDLAHGDRQPARPSTARASVDVVDDRLASYSGNAYPLPPGIAARLAEQQAAADAALADEEGGDE